jgi:hypothetical protein
VRTLRRRAWARAACRRRARRDFGARADERRGDAKDGRFDEVLGARVAAQHLLDLAPERRVARAGRVEKGLALGRVEFERLLEQPVHLLPALGLHSTPPSPEMAR